MQYRDLTITVKTADVQKASDIALMLNVGGIYTEDYSDLEENEIVRNVGIVDEQLLAKDKSKAVLHIYIDEFTSMENCTAFLEERYNSENICYKMEINIIDEEDYANSWKQYYKPIKTGDSIVIVPEWEDYSVKDNEIILKMDPGMAFGTGTHETTSMCVEAIQKYIKPNDKVLDIGCGSGILSIASVLCGASEATAVDIDEIAAKTTVKNAQLNGIQNKITAYCDNILNKDSDIHKILKNKNYSAVTANIVADVIMALSGFIEDYTQSGAVYIFSGIIDTRKEEVEKKLIENSFKIKEVLFKNGWICFIAEK